MTNEKRFVCIDVGYGDDWYITDNGKRLFEMEIVALLNEQQATIEQLRQSQDVKEFSALFNQSIALQREIKDLKEENEQLKQEIKQYWKCRDKWKQEAKELKKEADYFERKKCEYWNMYNEAHLDKIILKKENEQLKKARDESDKFIVKKGLEIEFLEWCMK